MLPLMEMLITLVSIQLVILLGWTLRLGRATTARPGFMPPSREEMKQNVLWHAFYVNPADPRGWVPKTFGIGYTVNFRTERNAKVFAALIVSILASAVALAVVAHRTSQVRNESCQQVRTR